MCNFLKWMDGGSIWVHAAAVKKLFFSGSATANQTTVLAGAKIFVVTASDRDELVFCWDEARLTLTLF